jgi:hypothetical protein
LKGLQAGMADDPQVKQLIEARMASEQLEASQRQFEQAQSAKGH